MSSSTLACQRVEINFKNQSNAFVQDVTRIRFANAKLFIHAVDTHLQGKEYFSLEDIQSIRIDGKTLNIYNGKEFNKHMRDIYYMDHDKHRDTPYEHLSSYDSRSGKLYRFFDYVVCDESMNIYHSVT